MQVYTKLLSNSLSNRYNNIQNVFKESIYLFLIASIVATELETLPPQPPTIKPGPEIERVPEPIAISHAKCCKSIGVPEMCSGLCMDIKDSATRSRASSWLNACANFERAIENCFKMIAKEGIHTNYKEGVSE